MTKDEARKVAVKAVEDTIETLDDNVSWQVVQKLPEEMANNIAIAYNALTYILRTEEAAS